MAAKKSENIFCDCRPPPHLIKRDRKTKETKKKEEEEEEEEEEEDKEGEEEERKMAAKKSENTARSVDIYCDCTRPSLGPSVRPFKSLSAENRENRWDFLKVSYHTPAVNIMLMPQAPLVGRAGGLSEGQGASAQKGEEREKEKEDDER